VELSVIICTHNPRKSYFSRVLEALRIQTLDKEQWELLVIDNASTEPLEQCWDLSWHPHARHVREDQLGLDAARQRGMREFSTDLVVFVDDDNVLAPDYLAQVIKIKREWPFLGVWGSGRIAPEFESEPQKHHADFLPILVVRDIRAPRWSNTFPAASLFTEVTPFGAGQCIRADVAKAYCEAAYQSNIRITGRHGNVLLAGEDVEVCFVACKLGRGMGIFPELQITHLIRKERTTDGYFLRIGEFTVASQFLLQYKWQGIMPQNPFSLRGMVSAVRQAIIKRGFRRRMHFAGVRGAIRARSIINAARERTAAFPEEGLTPK
jgi:glycosyltransferase involved in cell wall biosynthesis